MSNPRIVKSLNQVAITTRIIGGDGLQWGLEVKDENGAVVDFEVMSDLRKDLAVSYEPLSKNYIVTLVDRTSDPDEYHSHASLTTDSITYDFAEDQQNRTRVIIVEDITIHLQVHGQSPAGQYILTLFIQSVPNEPTKFKHEFWHHVFGQNAQT